MASSYSQAIDIAQGRKRVSGGRIVDAQPQAPYDPFADVGRAQELTRSGVAANAELLRPELMQQIGSTLGGLNEIGALRSGGTKVALDDINRQFTDRIGAISQAATLGALDAGLGAGGMRLQREGIDMERQRMKDERRRGLMSAIGSVIGAGIGFAVGGPAGAAVGGSVMAGHDGSVGT